MTFKTALRARVKANGVVSGAGAGVYWSARPQTSNLPAIVLETIAGSADQSFSGVTDTQGNRVQATAFAETQAEAEQLRQAVQDVFVSSGEQDGMTFQRGFVNLFRDGVDNTPSGEVFHDLVDATIWFN